MGCITGRLKSLKKYKNQGDMHYTEKNYNQAIISYKTCIALDEHFQDKLAITKILKKIGACYYNLGNVQDAINNYNKAKQLIDKEIPSPLRELEKIYNELGTCYMTQNSYDEGLDHYTQLKIIQDKTLAANDPKLINTYKLLGNCCIKTGKVDEALNIFLQCKDKLETFHPTSPELPKIFNIIGKCYKSKGLFIEAYVFFEKSKSLYEKNNYSDQSN